VTFSTEGYTSKSSAQSGISAPRPRSFHASGPLSGSVAVPGDKSISHRAIILASLAIGESQLTGLLDSADVQATANAMHAMGATIERRGATWHVHGVGVGGLLQPLYALDLGNSGTSARLLAGLIATHPITATLVGDASLCRRPMDRVMAPLSLMGAEFTAAPGGRLPLTVRGLVPAPALDYRLPLPSAQVKTALLLAALNTPGITRITEPQISRDHGERLLAAFGANIKIETDDHGARVIAVRGEGNLIPQTIAIPGDLSSAAFPLVAALIVRGSRVMLQNVGVNPTRTGLVQVLREMGADLALSNQRDVCGEPVADVTVAHSPLYGTTIPAELAPIMIDEYPILFIAAACASGPTTAHGIAELRHKESDRIAAMAAGLRAIGVDVEEGKDSVTIHGNGGDILRGGATIATQHDHRVAMAFAVAGLHAREAIEIDDMTCVETSFPDFEAMLEQLEGTR